MRKLNIAYGNSCFAKTWSNKQITFDELRERLKTTIRTSETVAEYPKLSKEERNKIKDKGGFVGGLLKDNRRKAANVVSRSMLSLDVDSAKVGFIEDFCEKFDKAFCLYSTHRHTKDAPRVRIVIPLTRDVTSDEYTAITRYLASEWDIDQFDECSYMAHQLMYWPTTSSDGEYVYKEKVAEWFNPDEFLNKHPNWQDYSLLPTSSRESKVRNKTVEKQKDPLEKSGIVGAFCRAYTIHEVIDTFLSDIYEPSVVEGRYSYIPATSSAGVIVYDDKFLYSHHATDPACCKLLNAFDLVRIHKFGDDEKESVKQMLEFAASDDNVKLLLTEERIENAQKEFTGQNWKEQLTYTPKTCQLENTVKNLILILENDEDFKNIVYNEMSNRIQVIGKVPWNRPDNNSYWRDADMAQLKAIIDIKYAAFSNRNYDIAFTKVIDDRHVHPVREYLDSLPEWDKVKRVEKIYVEHMGAEDNEYTHTLTRKSFAGAVARIYEPGVKFDSALVLDGDQGIGKSSLIKDLVLPDYFTDALSMSDIKDKTAAEKIQGFWAVEISELSGMSKAEIEKVRAFMSCQDDMYRPSYGRTVESHPRQCFFVATVNGENGYLRDITGNRRWWIIKCNKKEQKKTWNFTKEFLDQFWAEAKYYYLNGEELFLRDDVLEESEKIQKSVLQHDDRVGLVEEYLDMLLPDNWDDMTIYERRAFINKDELSAQEGTRKRTYVTNAEIWCECFGSDLSSIKQFDSFTIASIMLQIPGWRRTQTQKRIKHYGKQRIYERIE